MRKNKGPHERSRKKKGKRLEEVEEGKRIGRFGCRDPGA